jgi:lactoylglutathione lyase
LFEAHLTVHDLDCVIAFRDRLGLELAYVLPERQVAFVWIGGPGHSMLGLWVGSASPNTLRLHLAFGLDLEAVLAAPPCAGSGSSRSPAAISRRPSPR